MNRPAIRSGSSVFLALCLVLSILFSSCGLIVIHGPAEETSAADTGTTVDDGSTGSGETEPEGREVEIPRSDLGGVAVFITCAAGESSFAPEDESASLGEVVAARNKTVEERLHTTLLTRKEALAVIESEIRTASLAGIYYTDLVSIPLSSVCSLQKSGLLAEINTLPYVDLSLPCYSQSAAAQFSLSGAVYAVAGEALNVCADLPCVFVNNALAASLGTGDLYGLARAGKWTVGAFSEKVELSTRVYGVYGFGYDEDRSEIASRFFFGAGGRYYTSENGRPALNAGKEKEETILSSLSFLYDPSFRYNANDGKALERFYEGGMLFYISDLGKSAWLVDMKDDWGVLPMPKHNEKQDGYLSLVPGGSPAVAAPSGNPMSDRAGILLQTLFAASSGMTEEAGVALFIDKYARNNDCLNSVWMICRSPVYSFHTAYGSYYPALTRASVSASDEAVSSGVSWESAARYYQYAVNEAIRLLT